MTRTILKIDDVVSKVGMCRASVYNLAAAGEFPAAVQVGRRSSGWFAHEVDEWLDSRPRGSRPPEDALKARWGKEVTA